EIPVLALLPDTYVKDQSQRLYYYQKMMSSRDEATLGEVQAEVEDRYGHQPPEVKRAFTIMSQRIRAKALSIEKLDARQGRLSIVFRRREEIPPRVFTILARKNREAYLARDNYI